MSNPQATHPALDFSLKDFEAAVFRLDTETAVEQLLNIINFASYWGDLNQVLQRQPDNTEILHRAGLAPFRTTLPVNKRLEYYNRLASAITALFSHSPFNLTERQLNTLLLMKATLQLIFTCSSYPNMDHILRHQGILKNHGQLELQSEQDCQLLLLSYTTESDFQIDFSALLPVLPKQTLYAYIGVLAPHGGAFTEKSNSALAHLHQQAHLLDQQTPGNLAVLLIATPWMLCSYCSHPNPHQLKRHLNQCLENFLSQALQTRTQQRIQKQIHQQPFPRQKKPRLVLACERYTSPHAMYRCYHNHILPLKQDYELVFVGPEYSYDAISIADFDQVVRLPSDRPEHIDQIVNCLLDLEPDAIFYPSLGMSSWTILCCNLRLAKHQVMSLGHPATSMSRHIDYAVVAAETHHSAEHYRNFFSETLIFGQQQSFHCDKPSSLLPNPLPNKTFEDDIIRIAINSTIIKVTYPLLQICQQICQQSSVDIEFHFFNGDGRGLVHDAAEKNLKSMLPNSVLHKNSHYRDYLSKLAQCDLALPTFPFGGSNSNIDLALLGIPKIIYQQPGDLAAETDQISWSPFSLPSFMYTNSMEGILASAIYLIHNQAARQAVRQHIKAAQPEQQLFLQEDQEKPRQGFLSAFQAIFNDDT